MQENKGAGVSGNRPIESGIAKRDRDRDTYRAKQAAKRAASSKWGMSTNTDKRWS